MSSVEDAVKLTSSSAMLNQSSIATTAKTSLPNQPEENARSHKAAHSKLSTDLLIPIHNCL
jgi:hypothetical protein